MSTTTVGCNLLFVGERGNEATEHNNQTDAPMSMKMDKVPPTDYRGF